MFQFQRVQSLKLETHGPLLIFFDPAAAVAHERSDQGNTRATADLSLNPVSAAGSQADSQDTHVTHALKQFRSACELVTVSCDSCHAAAAAFHPLVRCQAIRRQRWQREAPPREPPHPEVGWVNVLAERQGLQHVLQWPRDIQRPPQREAGGGADLGAAAAAASSRLSLSGSVLAFPLFAGWFGFEPARQPAELSRGGQRRRIISAGFYLMTVVLGSQCVRWRSRACLLSIASMPPTAPHGLRLSYGSRKKLSSRTSAAAAARAA